MSRHRQYTEKATPVDADILVFADTEDINPATTFEKVKRFTFLQLKTFLGLTNLFTTIDKTEVDTNSNLKVAGSVYTTPSTITPAASVNADCYDSNIFELTPGENTAITFTNIGDGGSYTIYIDNTGAYTNTITNTIEWIDGTAYPSNSGKSVVNILKLSGSIVGSWGDVV